MLIARGGVELVCGIVFVETGLFVGCFLPGDSLLVIAGVLAWEHYLSLSLLLTLVTLCAVAGDQLGYAIGRKAGDTLYQREDTKLFKRRHLQEAHEFYEKHGAKAVIIARFVPIIRTFCPPVAGAAKMNYRRYLTYDIFGGLLWVWSMVLVGYTIGHAVPHVDKWLHLVIAVVIVLSLMPAAYHAWQARRRSSVPIQTSK
jgi:membrane-associated protein